MNYIFIYILVFWIHQTIGFGFFRNIIKRHQSKINEINGFYGLVGPNINISKVETLYELFTGDGIIQGVFLENGDIQQISHIVQTEKVKHEKIHGKFINNMMVMPMYMFMNKIGMIPNVMGLANTAFLNIKDRFFILFERDLPYEIKIDFDEKKIETIQKIKIDTIDNFSGHSKFDKKMEKVYSLEYNVLLNTVSLLYLNEKLNILKKTEIKTKYMPIVHDSAILSKSIIFSDSPLQFSFKDLIKGKIPVIFDNTKPTFIYEIDRETGSKIAYCSSESFYIFHYGDVSETDGKLEILAPIYDSLDFSKINIHGKYRRLILDKNDCSIKMERNLELDEYNLDFPIKWRDCIILRNIENRRINGFIICRGLEIERRIFFKNLSICGEPVIYDSGSWSRIICFGYDIDMKGYLVLIDPENGSVFKFPLEKTVTIGFHSIFINKLYIQKV